jgi:hypothetical protein
MLKRNSLHLDNLENSLEKNINVREATWRCIKRIPKVGGSIKS